MLCAILGLVVLFQLLTKSATLPSPVVPSSASPQLCLETVTDKQFGSSRVVHRQPTSQLQLNTYLAAKDVL